MKSVDITMKFLPSVVALALLCVMSEAFRALRLLRMEELLGAVWQRPTPSREFQVGGKGNEVLLLLLSMKTSESRVM